MAKTPSIDYLVRATDQKSQLRVFAARTTRLVEEARQRHKTFPTATAGLGRVLTAAALMGAMHKGNETVTLRVLGDGPIGGIVADANAEGEVRGYAKNPSVHVPLNPWEKFDVAAAVGKEGSVHVTYELESGMYSSSSPLVSGEIAKDLVYFFYSSEQIPSVVSLGVLVGWESVQASGGLILQLLPGADKSLIPVLEKRAESLADVSRLIQSGKTPEDLIELLLEPSQIRILDKRRLHFRCRCSKSKLKDTLLRLGRTEIADILEKDGKVEAVCHFCENTYVLQRREIEALLESGSMMRAAAKEHHGDEENRYQEQETQE